LFRFLVSLLFLLKVAFNALFYSFVVSNYLIYVPLIKLFYSACHFITWISPLCFFFFFFFFFVLFCGFVFMHHFNSVICDYVLVDFDGSDAHKTYGAFAYL